MCGIHSSSSGSPIDDLRHLRDTENDGMAQFENQIWLHSLALLLEGRGPPLRSKIVQRKTKKGSDKPGQLPGAHQRAQPIGDHLADDTGASKKAH